MEMWPTLTSFEEADARRRGLREVEFGSRWMTAADAPAWRAAWLETTGELYVACLGDDGEPGPVELLTVIADRATVEVTLRGWWNLCGWPGSLPWLRRHVRDAAGTGPVGGGGTAGPGAGGSGGDGSGGDGP